MERQCLKLSMATNNQQPTTNNQQPTTNNQQPTTNNQQPTTNNQQPTTIDAAVAMDVLIPENYKSPFISAYKQATNWNNLAFVAGINKHGPVKTTYFDVNGEKKYSGGYKRKRKSYKRKKKSYKRKSYKRKRKSYL
jgi:hypothetical protein